MYRLKYRQLIVKALCLLSLSFCLACGAVNADNSPSNVDNNLDKLETKLFQHTYAKDSPEDRLNRLENMIFGESKKGSTDERIAALLTAVPNLDSTNTTAQAPALPLKAEPPPAAENSQALGETVPFTDDKKPQLSKDEQVPDQSNYPAVSAMEMKVLNKDYAGDPVQDRLARLEKKVLGKVSDSDDLSDRVDHLKQATGVDVAKRPASASDWLEDNEDNFVQSPMPTARTPDIYQDMQRAYNSGAYPFDSAYYPDVPTHKPVSIKSFGLSQQVGALEHEVFHKTYDHDPLPARLNRLETAVFADQKPAVDKPLPQRVDNLLAKVPISQKELQNLAALNGIDSKGGFDQTNSTNIANGNNPNNVNPTNKQSGGLGKLMNSLGNMLSGSGMTGSFPMTGAGNYVVDPKTGMLVNPATGTVINPNTGTTYGAAPYNQMSPYGYNPYGMGGMGGFGMSPYGMGPGFGFGNGGMGMGFGFR